VSGLNHALLADLFMVAHHLQLEEAMVEDVHNFCTWLGV